MSRKKFSKIKKSILSTWEDVEILRINKNLNKDFFFLKEEITKQDQEEWFSNLLLKDDDFMFICFDVKTNNKFGSIGFRIVDGNIDFYNIMRFCPSEISMEECIKELIEFSKNLFPGKKIQVRVLKNNPAVGWYKKIGFEVYEERNNFLVMYYS